MSHGGVPNAHRPTRDLTVDIVVCIVCEISLALPVCLLGRYLMLQFTLMGSGAEQPLLGTGVAAMTPYIGACWISQEQHRHVKSCPCSFIAQSLRGFFLQPPTPACISA